MIIHDEQDMFLPCVHGVEIHECPLEHYIGCGHRDNIAECQEGCLESLCEEMSAWTEFSIALGRLEFAIGRNIVAEVI